MDGDTEPMSKKHQNIVKALTYPKNGHYCEIVDNLVMKALEAQISQKWFVFASKSYSPPPQIFQIIIAEVETFNLQYLEMKVFVDFTLQLTSK